MKKLANVSLRLFCIISISLFVLSNANAQSVTDDKRGMYVNNFLEVTDNGIVIPEYSILGITYKEDALLNYAKENHIQYLILYDMSEIFYNDVDLSVNQKEAFKAQLRAFIRKAKTNFQIQEIGAVIPGDEIIDPLNGSNQRGMTPEYELTPSEATQYPDLLFVTQTYSPTDPMARIAEFTKLAMRLSTLSYDPNELIDFFSVEYEFWKYATNLKTFDEFETISEHLATVKLAHNALGSHKLYTEVYFDNHTNNNTPAVLSSQDVIDFIDGKNATNTIKLYDRVLITFYTSDPERDGNEKLKDVNGNFLTDYYQVQNGGYLDLFENNAANGTITTPLFSPALKRYGSDGNYYGSWLYRGFSNNIFMAERIFYDSYLRDDQKKTDGSKNIISPGAATWYASGMMLNLPKTDHPSSPGAFEDVPLVKTNSPICVASGGTGTLELDYVGPIEAGVTGVSCILKDNGGSTIGTSSNTSAVANYTTTNANLIGTLNESVSNITLSDITSIPINASSSYSLTTTITYSNGASNTSTQFVKVVSTQVIERQNTGVICEEESVTLIGIDDATWYQDDDLGGANPRTKLNNTPQKEIYVKPSLTGGLDSETHKYYYESASTTCPASSSEIEVVTIYKNPAVVCTTYTATPDCGKTLKVTSDGDTYKWSTGANTQSILVTQTGNFKVIVTQTNGCTNIGKEKVSASGNLQVTISAPPIGCIGNTGTLTANATGGSGSYTFTWHHSGSSDFIGNPLAGVTTGDYSVTVNDGTCTDTRTETLEEPFAANAGPDEILASTCGTTSTILNANKPNYGTGSWSIQSGAGGSFVDNTNPNTSFAGVAGTTYVLRWSIAKSGCTTTTDDVIITFNQNPTVANAGNPQTICSMSGFILGANNPVVGVGTWSITGGPNTNVNQFSNVNSNAAVFTPTTSGTYNLTWTISNSPCTNSFSNVTITVNSNPDPSIIEPSSSICTGGTLTLHAVTTSGVSYQWTLNGTAINGATSDNYTATQAGDYRLVVTNQGNICNATSSIVTITVNSNPDPSISEPSSSICTGGTLTLHAVTTSGVSYQWTLNGTTIIGATSDNYVATQAGDYRLVVTNQGNICSATSSIVTITVNSNPDPSISEPSSSICTGGTLTLHAVTTSGVSYQWTLNGTAINGATSDNYTATQAGDYRLVVTNQGNICNATSSIVTITVNSNPDPSISEPSSSICTGGTLTLHAVTTSGVSYQWTLNGTAINGATSDNYTATQAGDYRLVVTNQGNICNATSSIVTITVNSNPDPSISEPNSSICTGGTLTLHAVTTSGVSYQWTLNGTAINGATSDNYTATQAGDYRLVVTNQGNICNATSSIVTITVNSNPDPSISEPSSSICTGGTLTLHAVTTSGVSYQWTLNGTAINGATSDNYTATQAGDYRLVVTNQGNICNATSSIVTITVNSNPDPSISEPSSSICTGGTLTLHAVTTSGVSYQWTLNGTTINGATSDNYVATQAGDYRLVVTNQGNICNATSSIVTIGINVPITNLILDYSDISCNSTNDGQVAVVTIPSNVAANYSWNTTPTQTTAGITNLPLGNYSVTVTDLCNANSELIYSVNIVNTCCHTVAQDISVDASGHVLSIASNTNYNLNSSIVLENGNNLGFAQNTVYIASGVSITVKSGSTLILSSSHLLACGGMWKGIIVETGGILLIYDSEIDDADIGINLQNASLFHTYSNNILKDNAIGMKVTGSQGMFVVENVIFEGSGTLKNRGHLGSDDIINYPLAGIFFNNSVSSIGGSTGPNIFRNMNNGIISENSELMISHSKFENIQSEPNIEDLGFAIKSAHNGTIAIVGYGKSSSTATFKNCQAAIQANDCFGFYANEIYMQNVGRGISVTRTASGEVVINDNRIDAKTFGIFLDANESADKVDVINNQIDVAINTSTSGSETFGIVAMNVNPLAPSNLLINENVVNMYHNYSAGIKVENCLQANILFNRVNLFNPSTIGSSIGFHPGIEINHSNETTIGGNKINPDLPALSNNISRTSGIQSTMCADWKIVCNTTDFTTEGISFYLSYDSEPTVGLSGNEIKNHDVGMFIHSGQIGIQEYRGNLWSGTYSSTWGAKIDPAAPLQSSVFYYDTKLNDGITDEFDYFPTTPNTGLFDPSHGVQNEVPCIDQGYLPVKNCDGQEITEEDLVIANQYNGEWNEETRWIGERHLYSKLIRCPELVDLEPVLGDFFNMFGELESQRLLSEIDQRLANAVDYDSEEDSLLDTYNLSIEVLTNQTESLITQYDNESDEQVKLSLSYQMVSTSQQINQITDLLEQVYKLKEDGIEQIASELKYDNLQASFSEEYEINAQNTNDVHLRSIESASDYTNDDIALIEDIANQCPVKGGQAVYSARAMLALMQGPKNYDDNYLCFEANIAMRKQVDSKSKVIFEKAQLKPNPATNQVTINYTLAADNKAEFILWDAQGKIAKSKELFSSANSVEVDLTSLVSGLYYYRIKTSTASISEGKLSILK